MLGVVFCSVCFEFVLICFVLSCLFQLFFFCSVVVRFCYYGGVRCFNSFYCNQIVCCLLFDCFSCFVFVLLPVVLLLQLDRNLGFSCFISRLRC